MPEARKRPCTICRWAAAFSTASTEAAGVREQRRRAEAEAQAAQAARIIANEERQSYVPAK
jgi:hypothetical protein